MKNKTGGKFGIKKLNENSILKKNKIRALEIKCPHHFPMSCSSSDWLDYQIKCMNTKEYN